MFSSGVNKDGTLRIVKKGVGLDNGAASVVPDFVKDVFVLEVKDRLLLLLVFPGTLGIIPTSFYCLL